MRNLIESITVIDTHEHMPHEIGAVPACERDVLNRWLRHYTGADMRSAGLSADEMAFARDASIDVRERWAKVENLWEVCRFTGYGRSVSITARDLYGIEEINSDTIEALNDAHKAIYERDFLYELMHDKLNIEKAILDGFTGTLLDKDERIFARAWRPEIHVGLDAVTEELGINTAVFEKIEAEYGAINTLADWRGVFDAEYKKYAKHIAALKVGLAYVRSIKFDKADVKAAEADFAAAKAKWEAEGRTGYIVFSELLQNYMMRYILDVNAKGENLPIQVHTGYQEGSGNIIANSSPLNLNELILDYPETHFDIFHLGWPFTDEALALVKIHQNTSLDFAWANIISPHMARRMYIEAIDVLPINKICAFGGDYIPADLTYGHLTIAKENLAYALEYHIKENTMTAAQAEKCAKAMLYDNPKRIFRI